MLEKGAKLEVKDAEAAEARVSRNRIRHSCSRAEALNSRATKK